MAKDDRVIVTKKDRIHCCYVDDAVKYGPSQALFLWNLKFWIDLNKDKDAEKEDIVEKKHTHEGRTWTYNTLNAYASHLPYFSRYQIKRMIDKLVKEGVILKGNYNITKYDRTLWLAFVNEDEWL